MKNLQSFLQSCNKSLINQACSGPYWENIGPRSFLYGPRCARSVLSRPRADILPVRPSRLVNKIYVLVCYSYALVCTRMLLVCYSCVVLVTTFTRTRFHLKPHRFRCGYAFCLHDTDRDHCRDRVDLKTLPKVERFQNDTVLSVV